MCVSTGNPVFSGQSGGGNIFPKLKEGVCFEIFDTGVSQKRFYK